MPVLRSRCFGARRSGRGKGRLVRKGFVLRAVSMAAAADGGQMRVISVVGQCLKSEECEVGIIGCRYIGGYLVWELGRNVPVMPAR